MFWYLNLPLEDNRSTTSHLSMSCDEIKRTLNRNMAKIQL